MRRVKPSTGWKLRYEPAPPVPMDKGVLDKLAEAAGLDPRERPRAFWTKTSYALAGYVAVASVNKWPRPAHQVAGLAPIAESAAALATSLRQLDDASRLALRNIGFPGDLDALADDLGSVAGAARATVRTLQARNSRHRPIDHARGMVIQDLAAIFAEYATVESTSEYRTGLAEYIRAALAAAHIPVPRSDRKLLALVPSRLYPEADR